VRDDLLVEVQLGALERRQARVVELLLQLAGVGDGPVGGQERLRGGVVVHPEVDERGGGRDVVAGRRDREARGEQHVPGARGPGRQRHGGELLAGAGAVEGLLRGGERVAREVVGHDLALRDVALLGLLRLLAVDLGAVGEALGAQPLPHVPVLREQVLGEPELPAVEQGRALAGGVGDEVVGQLAAEVHRRDVRGQPRLRAGQPVGEVVPGVALGRQPDAGLVGERLVHGHRVVGGAVGDHVELAVEAAPGVEHLRRDVRDVDRAGVDHGLQVQQHVLRRVVVELAALQLGDAGHVAAGGLHVEPVDVGGEVRGLPLDRRARMPGREQVDDGVRHLVARAGPPPAHADAPGDLTGAVGAGVGVVADAGAPGATGRHQREREGACDHAQPSGHR
jgi:hypothetical protein